MYPSGIITATWMPPSDPDDAAVLTRALNGETSERFIACVVHIVHSDQTTSAENTPNKTDATRSASGCARHFHHHSIFSAVSPNFVFRGGRNGDRNRASPPPPPPPIKHDLPSIAAAVATASASNACITHVAYCAAVLRYTLKHRCSALRSRTRKSSSSSGAVSSSYAPADANASDADAKTLAFGVSFAIVFIAHLSGCSLGITSCVVSLARVILRSLWCAFLSASAATPTRRAARRGRVSTSALRHMLRGISTRPYPNRNTPVTMPNMLETTMPNPLRPAVVSVPYATRITTPKTITERMTPDVFSRPITLKSAASSYIWCIGSKNHVSANVVQYVRSHSIPRCGCGSFFIVAATSAGTSARTARANVHELESPAQKNNQTRTRP
eukprot:1561-Pelagococcus_subviridis.AAC.4